ncbi:uncharacterized protein MONBRDRAFT_34400 [Monosiga brevicollis MX1]|uniref:Trafficking protein particle complex subunit n=1 Tax=Monosiga brevicollis TaxID=81824 RepID=A9VBF9_MONBE|nr:uncharacterized protein MONBRDRAFT_34400 [Monosiga brevicollis MX1]EDQ85232.1 predicted protein [Monosiga brevicollis MX1]|eukprot:XP_001750057.1 hypothetical protein [Monosiga brevicollis MX1]
MGLALCGQVAQLLEDYEDDEDVNQQLDRMGFNIGVRIVDDFFSHTNQDYRCASFQEACNVIAKDGFRRYLGVVPNLAKWSPERTECYFILEDNPLVTFTEVPENHRGLLFSNILAGVIRGALETISFRSEVKFTQDALRGDPTTEIRVRLIEETSDEPLPED